MAKLKQIKRDYADIMHGFCGSLLENCEHENLNSHGNFTEFSLFNRDLISKSVSSVF